MATVQVPEFPRREFSVILQYRLRSASGECTGFYEVETDTYHAEKSQFTEGVCIKHERTFFGVVIAPAFADYAETDDEVEDGACSLEGPVYSGSSVTTEALLSEIRGALPGYPEWTDGYAVRHYYDPNVPEDSRIGRCRFHLGPANREILRAFTNRSGTGGSSVGEVEWQWKYGRGRKIPILIKWNEVLWQGPLGDPFDEKIETVARSMKLIPGVSTSETFSLSVGNPPQFKNQLRQVEDMELIYPTHPSDS